MTHYAEINQQTKEVLRVIVCNSLEWCESNLGGTWVITYYNTEGKNYAGKGHIYYEDKDNFSTPQPYLSWTLDITLRWQPPVPYPETETDEIYRWDEEIQEWIVYEP
jgi:hypothetical protein